MGTSNSFWSINSTFDTLLSNIPRGSSHHLGHVIFPQRGGNAFYKLQGLIDRNRQLVDRRETIIVNSFLVIIRRSVGTFDTLSFSKRVFTCVVEEFQS